MTDCSVEGCDKGAKAKGFCNMHYKRTRKTGSPGHPLELRFAESFCSISGCGRSVLAKGLCNMHYLRKKRHGQAGTSAPAKTPADGSECSATDCHRIATKKGLCEKHYMRLLRLGEAGVDRVSIRDQMHVVTYSGAHQRTSRRRGPASEHDCTGCGSPAFEWAYQHGDPLEILDEISRPYSLDPSHYAPMCVPCHRRFDARQADAA